MCVLADAWGLMEEFQSGAVIKGPYCKEAGARALKTVQ